MRPTLLGRDLNGRDCRHRRRDVNRGLLGHGGARGGGRLGLAQTLLGGLLGGAGPRLGFRRGLTRQTLGPGIEL